MKYCMYCRKELPEKAVFCAACGEEQTEHDQKQEDFNIQKAEKEVETSKSEDIVIIDRLKERGAQFFHLSTAWLKKNKKRVYGLLVVSVVILGLYINNEFEKSNYIKATRSIVQNLIEIDGKVFVGLIKEDDYASARAKIEDIRKQLNNIKQQIDSIPAPNGTTREWKDLTIQLIEADMEYTRIFERVAPEFLRIRQQRERSNQANIFRQWPGVIANEMQESMRLEKEFKLNFIQVDKLRSEPYKMLWRLKWYSENRGFFGN